MNAGTLAVIWVITCAVAGGAIIVAVEFFVTRVRRRRLMAAGLYPRPGTETDDDVRRLLEAGHLDMAIRCYQRVHRLSYQQAAEQLRVTRLPRYPVQFVGLALGIGLGVAIKNFPLGIALGILFGFAFGRMARTRRVPDERIK